MRRAEREWGGNAWFCKGEWMRATARWCVHHAAQPPAVILHLIDNTAHTLWIGFFFFACMDGEVLISPVIPRWKNNNTVHGVNRHQGGGREGERETERRGERERERSHVEYPVDSACRAFRGAEELVSRKKATDKRTWSQKLHWMAFLPGFACR